MFQALFPAALCGHVITLWSWKNIKEILTLISLMSPSRLLRRGVSPLAPSYLRPLRYGFCLLLSARSILTLLWLVLETWLPVRQLGVGPDGKRSCQKGSRLVNGSNAMHGEVEVATPFGSLLPMCGRVKVVTSMTHSCPCDVFCHVTEQHKGPHQTQPLSF